MANDSQGVTGINGKLVTQPKLPSSGTSSLEEPFRQVIQAPSPGNTATSRDSMKLVTQANVPGGDPKGKARD